MAFEDAQNSNWGTAREFSTDRLIQLATSSQTRPADFFAYVPPKPESRKHLYQPRAGGPIQWVEEDERARASEIAKVITLNLWSEVPTDTLFQETNSGVSLWAEVEWGSGGTMCRARVDIGRGVQVAMPADAMTVRLGCDALPPLTDESPVEFVPLPVTVNAMVGVGGTPRWKAHRTLLIPGLKNNETLLLKIPNFAWGVRMAGSRSSLTNAGLTVGFYAGSGVSWLVDSWTALMLKDPGEYKPLPNAAQYVLVSNGTGADIDALLSLEFALSM